MAASAGTVRPCFLIVDPEHGGAISTRKLVVETAKLNVMTAYSGAEAIETLRKFPALDGVVLDAVVRDIPCAELVHSLKAISPGTHIVVVGSTRPWDCAGADTYLDSFQPVPLLEQLRALERSKVDAITAQDSRLSSEGK